MDAPTSAIPRASAVEEVALAAVTDPSALVPRAPDSVVARPLQHADHVRPTDAGFARRMAPPPSRAATATATATFTATATGTAFGSAHSDATRVFEGEGEACTPRVERPSAKRAAQENLKRKLERVALAREGGPIKRVKLRAAVTQSAQTEPARAACKDGAEANADAEAGTRACGSRDSGEDDAFLKLPAVDPATAAAAADLFHDGTRAGTSASEELAAWFWREGAREECPTAQIPPEHDGLNSAAGNNRGGYASPRFADCVDDCLDDEGRTTQRRTLRGLLVRHSSTGVVSDGVAVKATTTVTVTATGTGTGTVTAMGTAKERRDALDDTAKSPARMGTGRTASGTFATGVGFRGQAVGMPTPSPTESQKRAAGVERRRKPTLSERLRSRGHATAAATAGVPR